MNGNTATKYEYILSFIETSLYFVSWLERGLLNPGFHMIALIFPIASDMETIW